MLGYVLEDSACILPCVGETCQCTLLGKTRRTVKYKKPENRDTESETAILSVMDAREYRSDVCFYEYKNKACARTIVQ